MLLALFQNRSPKLASERSPFCFPSAQRKTTKCSLFFPRFFFCSLLGKVLSPAIPARASALALEENFPFFARRLLRSWTLSLLSHRDSPPNSSLFPFFIPLHTNTRKVGTDFARIFSPVDSSLPLSLSLAGDDDCLPAFIDVNFPCHRETHTHTNSEGGPNEWSSVSGFFFLVKFFPNPALQQQFSRLPNFWTIPRKVLPPWSSQQLGCALFASFHARPN